MAKTNLRKWLSDPSQPAARYRYLVDIEGVRPSSSEARAARAEIPLRGWVADILANQRDDGYWNTRRNVYRPKYVSTNWNMLVLADLGAPGDDRQVKRGLDRMLTGFGRRRDRPFGSRRGGPHLCVTGNTARMFIQLGHAGIPQVRRSLDWLADTQLEDGGWDCFGRKIGTLDCWEALSAYAALGEKRLTRKWKNAMERGAEFYLERKLLLEGGSIWAGWKRIHYPNHYYYDLLVGLEILTSLGYGDDRRLRPALDMVRKKRRPDRTWEIERIHPDLPPGHGYGPHAEVKKWAASVKPQVVEPARRPSKWITLRALGVLGRVGK